MNNTRRSYLVMLFFCALIFLMPASQAWSCSPAFSTAENLSKIAVDLGGTGYLQKNASGIGDDDVTAIKPFVSAGAAYYVDKDANVHLCARVVLGLEEDVEIIRRADLNLDGNVDILDVQKVINLIDENAD